MTPTASKEGAGSCDPQRALVSDQADRRVVLRVDEPTTNPPECRMLQSLMVEDAVDTVRVTFHASSLYLQEDQDIWVTATDVNELLRFECLNVSVIHVYIR